MADRRPDNGDDPDGDAAEPTAGAPRWVKVFGVLIGLLVLLIVVLQVVGRGEHGPGRHASSDDGDVASWGLAIVPAATQTDQAPFQALDR